MRIPRRPIRSSRLLLHLLARLPAERNPPIRAVVGLGILDILAEFLRDENNPRLQFEAAWVLTNVASGTAQETQAVIAAGAVSAFIKGLSSRFTDV